MLDKVHGTGRIMPQPGILANQHNYRSVQNAVAANARNDEEDHDSERTHVVIIDSRQLERECLASSVDGGKHPGNGLLVRGQAVPGVPEGVDDVAVVSHTSSVAGCLRGKRFARR